MIIMTRATAQMNVIPAKAAIQVAMLATMWTKLGPGLRRGDGL
jgi:hypothetical protein